MTECTAINIILVAKRRTDCGFDKRKLPKTLGSTRGGLGFSSALYVFPSRQDEDQQGPRNRRFGAIPALSERVPRQTFTSLGSQRIASNFGSSSHSNPLPNLLTITCIVPASQSILRVPKRQLLVLQTLS